MGGPRLAERLIELATVHPIDRVASQIALAGGPEPANTDMGHPKRLGLPPLRELGQDLLETSAWTRFVVLMRPFLIAALYVGLFQVGLWPLAMLAIPFLYLTGGAALHDLCHKSLGVSDRWHDIVLCAVGALILGSGHTIRATHQVHHRKLHTAIDPEGYVDSYSYLRTLGEGPMYKHYLACWVMKNRPKARRWVMVEGGFVNLTILAALVAGWKFPVFGVYIAVTVFGSWLFPFFGVKLVHSDPGDDVLQGTRTVRGKIISRLGCGLSFHLEHHVYPRVPGHQLKFLSERLDGSLHDLGVAPTRGV